MKVDIIEKSGDLYTRTTTYPEESGGRYTITELHPILSPEEREKREKEISRALFRLLTK